MRQELPLSTSASGVVSGAGEGRDYIEHRVSKLDTLAGIAIKYGVEVADVKRANGLATDLQMFGFKILKIPLHGMLTRRLPLKTPCRLEPPSTSSIQENRSPPVSLSGPAPIPDNSLREKRRLSSAMNLLCRYYGLSSSPGQHSSSSMEEGMELTLYRSDGDSRSDGEPLSPLEACSNMERPEHLILNGQTTADGLAASLFPRLRLDHTPKSTSVLSGGAGDVEKGSEKSVQRRSKVGVATGLCEGDHDTILLKKVAQSSTLIGTDSKSGPMDGALAGAKKDALTLKVTKSMSASNLQDPMCLQVNISGTKYSSRMDTRNVSQAQPSARFLFEGLSKPRYKEALD